MNAKHHAIPDLIEAVKDFFSNAEIRDVTVLTRKDEILDVAQAAEGSLRQLTWHQVDGVFKKARVVKVLSASYVLLEEKGFLSSTASLVHIKEIASVSF